MVAVSDEKVKVFGGAEDLTRFLIQPVFSRTSDRFTAAGVCRLVSEPGEAAAEGQIFRLQRRLFSTTPGRQS